MGQRNHLTHLVDASAKTPIRSAYFSLEIDRKVDRGPFHAFEADDHIELDSWTRCCREHGGLLVGGDVAPAPGFATRTASFQRLMEGRIDLTTAVRPARGQPAGAGPPRSAEARSPPGRQPAHSRGAHGRHPCSHRRFLGASPSRRTRRAAAHAVRSRERRRRHGRDQRATASSFSPILPTSPCPPNNKSLA